MKRKTVVMILIVIMVFLIFACVGYAQIFSQNDQVAYEGIVFDLPEGYHETNSANVNEINFTNGFNSILFSKCNDSNLTKNVEMYKQYKLKNNYSVDSNNFTVGDVFIYKVTVGESKDCAHYWFDYKNKTFTIYTYDANKNTDNLVAELIKSIKSN